MIKQDLLSQLENAKNTYILGLAAISLFKNNKSFPLLEKSYIKFGTYTVDFNQVKVLLSVANDDNLAVKEFLFSHIRALIKESFELIKNYCNETNQQNIFHTESWYHFARMIRNCLSHNFKFEFTNYDKSILPVNWKAKSIDISLDGKFLEINLFGHLETWELFLEFQDFVLNRLT